MKYYFFGGDGGNDILLTPLLAYYKRLSKVRTMDWFGQDSAVGWLYPHSLQPDWMSELVLGRFLQAKHTRLLAVQALLI